MKHKGRGLRGRDESNPHCKRSVKLNKCCRRQAVCSIMHTTGYRLQSFAAATNQTQVVRKMSHKAKPGVQHLSVHSKCRVLFFFVFSSIYWFSLSWKACCIFLFRLAFALWCLWPAAPFLGQLRLHNSVLKIETPDMLFLAKHRQGSASGASFALFRCPSLNPSSKNGPLVGGSHLARHILQYSHYSKCTIYVPRRWKQTHRFLFYT